MYLFLLSGIVLVTCQQYESTEEELIQPNRIDEVSSNFVCNSDGYFADVTYGCQFYHVCENANNPYDKPSFVKHTFSCVNGTVFNQMSFTCTRYQDSIPCESSPSYFYLNKRNGDPKAYFLTDDDIVKPSNGLSKQSHSLSSNSLPTFSPPTTSRPATIVLRPSTTTGQFVTSSPVASRPQAVTLLQKSYDRPLQSKASFVPFGNDYESSSLSGINSYSSKARVEPFESISPKYSQVGLSKIKPGVRYSMKSAAKSKYEPAKKAFGYDSASTANSYVSNIRPESNFLPRSEANSESSANVQYRSLLADYKPSSSTASKIDQLLASFGAASSESKSGSKDNFGYHRAAIESPKVVPISSAISQPKRTAFTPAAFSKMYMENQQKTAKYTGPHHTGSLIASAPSKDINSRTRSESTYAFARPSTVETQTKSPAFSAFPAPPKEPAVQLQSKYQASSAEPNQNLLKSSQYVVPSSIRILEHPQSGGSKSAVTPLSAAPETEGADEPVKMSFVSKNSDNQNSVTDFGNLRVVKQVKGKNLLIDPSLENDPARDNIIAQVLEMLNKYN